MEFTAKQIALFIQGKVEGDENVSVHTFAKIEESTPGAISFWQTPNISIIFMTQNRRSFWSMRT